jgi:hypothetical protein
MAIASSLGNLLLPSTALLAAVTLGVGLSACPLESAPLQHAFVWLSGVTSVGAVASLLRHLGRQAPCARWFRFEFVLVPLVLFWGFLLVTCNFLQVREASARTQMINNGKQIGLAVQIFNDDNKRLPTDIHDAAGAPLLSWRVAICPYMEALPLHRQFDLAKSWDSPANRPLIDKMPITFASVLFSQGPGQTPWQGFVGPGTAFEPGQSLSLARDFPDGTSNTILVIEAQQQVPWSKPADIAFGPNLPLPPLGQPYTRRGDWPFCCPVQDGPTYFVCMADGTVRVLRPDVSESTLRALIVRNDGQAVELPD